jgi:hypothetical protein
MKNRPIKVLLLLISMFLGIGAFGQANFSLGDTIVYLNKDISFGTLHEYTSISSADTLQMRWIKRPSSRYPQVWNTYWTAADTVHGIIDNLDSADFVLAPPTDTTLQNRLIIGVAHNGQAASANIDFTLFEIGNRSDSLRVRFQVTVASLSSMEAERTKIEVFPTVSRNGLFKLHTLEPLAEQDILVFDVNGKMIPFEYTLLGEEVHLRLQTKTAGTYYLQAKNRGDIIKLMLL